MCIRESQSGIVEAAQEGAHVPARQTQSQSKIMHRAHVWPPSQLVNYRDSFLSDQKDGDVRWLCPHDLVWQSFDC